MADVLHVHPDLVRSAGFQHAFNQCYIIKTFQYLIMRNGFFAMIAFGVSFK